MSEINKPEHINQWLPVRRKDKPNVLTNILIRTLKFDKINHLYNKTKKHRGINFVRSILHELNISYDIDPKEIKNIPRNGPCILISNHPFGGLEGLILYDLLYEKRPDLKVIANFLFEEIEPISNFFISVNPFEYVKTYNNYKGLKAALNYLKSGGCILIFPAGEVSAIKINNWNITDKKWNKSAIKFIKKAKVPVVPIYFKGTNSVAFQVIGLLNPVLRTIKLPSELLNKSNRIISLRIGQVIDVNEQNKFDKVTTFGLYLRARTYALANYYNISVLYSKYLQPQQASIIDQIDPEKLYAEISSLLPSDKLYEQNQYEIYCTTSDKIPSVLLEIGRLREHSFRLIGEGTNNNIDLDEFDYYYYHLFIWNKEYKQIVGAYRLGPGDQIMQQYGVKGFYTSTLFKFKKPFYEILQQSLELGRSFIVPECQKSTLPLFLLWKGIFLFLQQHPEYKNLIGPVSISDRYSDKAKNLLVKHIIQHHFDHNMAAFVKPRKKYRPKFKWLFDDILVNSIDTIEHLDDLIYDLEKKRLPVLLKKYIMINGKIISFNIDPAFSNVLDGLLVLDINQVPSNIIQQFKNKTNQVTTS